MTVDSGNVRPDVYAPTVEFTLAANAGRDLQAATDADHDAFLPFGFGLVGALDIHGRAYDCTRRASIGKGA